MRHALLVITTLLASLLLTPSSSAAGKPLTEYEVKAAFLLKFLTYISWPEESSLANPDAFRIGVIGTDPFGSTLDEIVGGRQVNGRPVEIKRVSAPDSISDCHLLFVADVPDSLQNRIFRMAEQCGVVTVGEPQAFIEAGGVIRLRLLDDRVRFDINLSVADRSGVRISSRMLQLAQEVIR